MGIYMAIYIHRDLKSSVQGEDNTQPMQKYVSNRNLGMSKSVVAAGLIGGRVGNKGGVGISLKLAGATFLFLNVHLAGATLHYSYHFIYNTYCWQPTKAK